jgi:hypothetical protein
LRPDRGIHSALAMRGDSGDVPAPFMERRPLWLWPNLLSLDAPLVAVVWLWMFAKSWRVVSFPSSLYWLVAAMVWIIYVVDRLLDSQVAGGSPENQSERHFFHARFRVGLWIGVILAAISCLVLLASLPTGLWTHGAFVLVFVVFYFLLVFLQDEQGVSYLKNVLAGLAFAYGTAVGVHFYRPDSNLLLFLFSREVLVFGVLCILNITAIDLWAAGRRSKDAEVARSFELLLSLLLLLLFLGAFFMAGKSDEFAKPFFISVIIAAGSLYAINKIGSRLSAEAQRVLADVAMLLPLPVFYVSTM